MISAALAVLETDEQRNELAEFYKKNKERLYAISYSKLHNDIAAEDAVQETFLQISDKPNYFFNVALDKRRVYADVIVKNISCEMIREKLSKPVVNLDDYEDEIAPDISTEDIVIDNESAHALVEFIRAMPEGKKDALLFRVLHKMSISEIARILNISEETARKRLSRAKMLIKEFLERRNNE